MQQIGIVGLGVMGENLALNISRNGYSVAGFDLDAAKVTSFADRTAGTNAVAATTLPAVHRFARRRRGSS